MTQMLIAVGTTARNYILLFAAALVGGDHCCSAGGRERDSAREKIDRVKLRMPIWARSG